MKKSLQVSDFARAGINSDLLPWDLPASFLTHGNNLRISNKRIKPFGGYSVWAEMPNTDPAGFIMHVGSTSGKYWLIGCLDSLYSWDGTTFNDVTNVAGYAGIIDESLWSGCMLSSLAVVSNPGDYPQYWDPDNPSGLSVDLPWDATNTWRDVSEHCDIIRSHKQFLFALRVTVDGVQSDDAVRWSVPADINGVPETWDPIDTTKVAGLTNLGGDGGIIIDGFSLRDAFVVYREKSVSIFDYVGGNFVWQIRHQSTSVGLLATDCLVEVKGKHFFIGDGDVLVNDGNSIQSLMHHRLRVSFISDFNDEFYFNAYAVKHNVLSEVWFCIPSGDSEFPNKAYIYNWRDDSWAIRDLPVTAHGSYGSQQVGGPSWGSVVGTWLTISSIWNSGGLSPLQNTIVAIQKGSDNEESSFNRLLLPDYNDLSITTKYNFVIEREGFPLEGMDQVTTITRVYPHMDGPGDCFVQVGSQDWPGAPTRWKPAVLFRPTLDRKVDVRTTGELHCFRIYKDDVEAVFNVSGFDIEYVLAGER